MFDPVQPEHAVVLAAGQLLPEVVASGHVTGTRDQIYAAAHRGSTGLLPCRYIILFVQRGETVSNKQFYIYGIYVDGVVRYIGKGKNRRMHFHVIEARRINSRRARGANTDRTSTKFYRKLAEAMRHGAIITGEIMLDGLTNQRAYRIEKQKIEELHKQKPDQLWNTIDERLIGVTWEEFKRKQREESFQQRQAHRAVGGPAGSQAARFARSLVRAARAERRLQKG